MPNITVFVESHGKVTLTDKNYVASGGEACIYVNDKYAYKIYHDVAKMIPLTKIKELSQISADNVLKPKSIIRNTSDTPIGYVMDFKKGTHPLCKLFTKGFRAKNNVSDENIIDIIKRMQETISQIHKDGCLIVDLNELNFLISSRFKIPYFIDVDSYQTPSFKASAIMESIRDRQVKGEKFTELSDWFSFAVIAFQMYVGIHPYRGRHPDYAPNEWGERMDKGISVFDKDVKLPRVCNDFSIIPAPHLEWFKDIFVKGNRAEPPVLDHITIVQIPESFKTALTSGAFDIDRKAQYEENIISVFNFMGINYVVGINNIYKENAKLPNDISGSRVELASSSDMTPIIAKFKDGEVVFENINTNVIGRISADNMMARNGCVYTVFNGKLTENSFEKLGNKTIHKARISSNVLDNATKVFDGIIFQDLLGKCFVNLPFERGKCIFQPIKDLNGYKILEAVSSGNVCGVMAEKKGIYSRFVISFNDKFTAYTIRSVKDIPYGNINLTMLPNGICIMATDNETEIFKGNQLNVVSNPPFDESMRLFNVSGGVHFINKNEIYSAKMKK